MKLFLLLVLFSSLSYAGGSAVQVPDYMQVHKPYFSVACIDEQTQQDMDACGKKSLSLAVKKMDNFLAALKKNYKASEPELLRSLETSQIAWENYKDTSCKLETYYSREGTGFESIWNGCLEIKINERISYLSWLADNP